MSDLHPKPPFYIGAFIILSVICWPTYLFMVVIVPLVEMEWSLKELPVQIMDCIIWGILWLPVAAAPFNLPVFAFIFGSTTSREKDIFFNYLSKR